MLSTDNQRISDIFKRLAEIAAKTSELTRNPNLSPAQKQAACDSYFREHDQITTVALKIFKKITKNPL
ncbi:hypothetical protein [Klebsiella pneumoniae]|uniref:hypothetical protein n=1 Tax=Klebsiella pneumoniae TaxID=573 RepID=UPI000F6270F1|nr:hypothetical protein [Klebsiella pneumoniae]EJL1886382.1 hypothetical protein [Klebsiella pneumoniae]EKR6829127.1 hypothetical protein [Klebsiella pneumoniae]EKS1182074.1 hypothetical protein [Klebsiella pneumoniae]EKS1195540.1 hypothetical protein [Klebsiella pneumoniae]EKU4165099.1 hypothetical protein [Klebsiella pneumoniae]